MADRLAEEVLRQCDQATCNLPVDIEAILTSYGLHLVWAGLSQEVPGLYIPEGNYIICNRANDPGRVRFTLAHELYHHLEYLRDPSNKYIRFYTPGRNNERRANRFAGALLMPKEAVINLHRLGKSPREMAAIFNVSVAALSVRLDELGITRDISA